MRSARFSVGVVGVALLVACVGCPGPSGPKTAPVKGTLSIDGKPADKLQITFSPVDSSLPSASGAVSSGSFELFSGAQGAKGAAPGKYKLSRGRGGQVFRQGRARRPTAREARETVLPREVQECSHFGQGSRSQVRIERHQDRVVGPRAAPSRCSEGLEHRLSQDSRRCSPTLMFFFSPFFQRGVSCRDP
jgi:hypothetical protein